jgi:hypothetical protein
MNQNDTNDQASSGAVDEGAEFEKELEQILGLDGTEADTSGEGAAETDSDDDSDEGADDDQGDDVDPCAVEGEVGGRGAGCGT